MYDRVLLPGWKGLSHVGGLQCKGDITRSDLHDPANDTNYKYEICLLCMILFEIKVKLLYFIFKNLSVLDKRSKLKGVIGKNSFKK